MNKTIPRCLSVFILLSLIAAFIACAETSDYGQNGNITSPPAALEAENQEITDPEITVEETTEPESTEEMASLPPPSEILSYPSDMAAADVYADVQTKSWVVFYESDLICGSELWNEFYDKVSRGEVSSVLIANYFCEKTYGRPPAVCLSELSYDGSTYKIMERTSGEDKYTEEEYKYLVKYDKGNEYSYILVHDDTYTYTQLYDSLFYSDRDKNIDFNHVLTLPK